MNPSLTFGCTNAHDSLEHDRHSKHLRELMRKLDSVLGLRGIESRVEEYLARSIVRQAAYETEGLSLGYCVCIRMGIPREATS